MQVQTVSVGIPTYNESGNIRTLLLRLLDQEQASYTLEHIYVSDDSSSDHTVREARSVQSPRITVLTSRKRQGQALNQNKLLAANTSDFLILINADILPGDTRFLEQMVVFARRQALSVHIIGSRVVPTVPITRFERIMRDAFVFRMDMAATWQKGDNLYTAIGAARGFSRHFASVFRFPEVASEDIYTYMWARQRGYLYAYCPLTYVTIKLPDNLHDHLKQSRRFSQSRLELREYFDQSDIRDMFTIPLVLRLSRTVREILRKPIPFLTYLIVLAYSRLLPVRHQSVIWDAVSSSKKRTAHTATRILIPNATGPANTGDQAILLPLLSLVRETYPESTIAIHSNFPDRYTESPGDTLSHTLYSYTVYDKPDFATRVFRTLHLLCIYILWKAGIQIVPTGPLGHILSDYVAADLIIFPGGGYLRSKKGVTQTLNVLMLLMIIDFARMSRGRTVMAPISFGPFGYPWLTQVAAKTLKRLDYVSVREKISHSLLLKLGVTSTRLSTDTALFVPYKGISSYSHPTVGFTIRPWLKDSSQANFEKVYATSLIRFAREHKLHIKPIIQVDAPGYTRDEDTAITARIVRRLKRSKVSVLATIKLHGLDHAIATYGKLTLLLGMRMHSNIIAATQHVPFVAIAYEHKTQGIADAIGYGSYVLPVERVTEQSLYSLLTETYSHRKTLRSRLKTNVARIARVEKNVWKGILRV